MSEMSPLGTVCTMKPAYAGLTGEERLDIEQRTLSVLPVIAKGEMVADIIAMIGSIDIVMGELDR